MIDPELKTDAEKILARAGLTASEAVEVYYRQIVMRGDVPFDLRLPYFLPMRSRRRLSLSETSSGWLEAANRVNRPPDGRVLQTDLVCAGRVFPTAGLAASRDLGAAPSAERPAT